MTEGTPQTVLREDILRRVYRCDVRIQQNPADGSMTVVPTPRLTHERSGNGIRVHVIAGGGTGEEILRRLCLHNYTVTCGVLNRGDSDTDVAAALEIETATEAPFSPVSPPALEAGRALVSKTDVVVVCGVPFGPGNVVNLDLAAQALADGRQVLIHEGVEDRDYTPGGMAAKKAAALVADGAGTWSSIADLMDSLPSATPSQPGAKT